MSRGIQPPDVQRVVKALRRTWKEHVRIMDAASRDCTKVSGDAAAVLSAVANAQGYPGSEAWDAAATAWWESAEGTVAGSACVAARVARDAAMHMEKEARDDLSAALHSATMIDLLSCRRPRVNLAAQFALVDEPPATQATSKDPVVKRVIASLQQAFDDACTADDVASAAEVAKLAAGIEISHCDDAREAFVVAVEDTDADLKAARKCKTIANLLSCPRSAVRMAAQFALALEPAPPHPKRKR